MSKQLRLLEPTPNPGTAAWRLDDTTRHLGRAGIESARQALRRSQPRYASPDTEAA